MNTKMYWVSENILPWIMTAVIGLGMVAAIVQDIRGL
jgi:hypothetical protein